ncbi:MAG: phosphoribosylamine--glycine ligase [Halobacteriovoraceae bacterium]|nr:phosphoribosylamine--glycine ligase [Halobacteriovoraceae bacterium]
MRVLIIGSGGREDAFAWKFQKEDKVSHIMICPGHKGMKRFEKVELWESSLLGNYSSLAQKAVEKEIDLVVCGPEAPLTEGLAKFFEDQSIPFFGPSESAALLEGSKIFSKEFMREFEIPTAGFQVFDRYEDAVAGLEAWPVSSGIVIKADGLAGGKGVVVTTDREVAQKTLFDFMKNPEVSIHSDRILFEHILPGEEVSAFALCNGEEFFFLGTACDHKRVFDYDEGPNTGGMGCYRDPLWPDADLKEKIIHKVLIPTLKGMKERGHPFKGILFMGLMINSMNEPFVIEYNVRFGDPEAQTLLPLIKGELAVALHQLSTQAKIKTPLSLSEETSVHVVMTSGGYPSITKDKPMSLNHKIEIPFLTHEDQPLLFLAGVNRNEDGQYINTGGRVLGVTAVSEELETARQMAYKGIEMIHFKDSHYRTDIAFNRRGGLKSDQ